MRTTDSPKVTRRSACELVTRNQQTANKPRPLVGRCARNYCLINTKSNTPLKAKAFQLIVCLTPISPLKTINDHEAGLRGNMTCVQHVESCGCWLYRPGLSLQINRYPNSSRYVGTCPIHWPKSSPNEERTSTAFCRTSSYQCALNRVNTVVDGITVCYYKHRIILITYFSNCQLSKPGDRRNYKTC